VVPVPHARSSTLGGPGRGGRGTGGAPALANLGQAAATPPIRAHPASGAAFQQDPAMPASCCGRGILVDRAAHLVHGSSATIASRVGSDPTHLPIFVRNAESFPAAK